MITSEKNIHDEGTVAISPKYVQGRRFLEQSEQSAAQNAGPYFTFTFFFFSNARSSDQYMEGFQGPALEYLL